MKALLFINLHWKYYVGSTDYSVNRLILTSTKRWKRLSTTPSTKYSSATLREFERKWKCLDRRESVKRSGKKCLFHPNIGDIMKLISGQAIYFTQNVITRLWRSSSLIFQDESIRWPKWQVPMCSLKVLCRQTWSRKSGFKIIVAFIVLYDTSEIFRIQKLIIWSSLKSLGTKGSRIKKEA